MRQPDVLPCPYHIKNRRFLLMIYRKLGNTGLLVSEIGLGGEWLERRS